MSDFQLVYFDFRGRAEAIRLLLHVAEQPYDDVRFSYNQWAAEPQRKAEAPYGQVPYIIYKGKKYAQSLAIGAFIARKFGLYGKTDEDGLRIDEVTHLCDDLRQNIRAFRLEFDPEKQAKIIQKTKEEVFPRFLGYFEALLADNGSTGYFVGNSVTLADVWVYDLIAVDARVFDVDSKTALDKYPCLQKLRDNVENIPSVKEYLKNRPKTQI